MIEKDDSLLIAVPLPRAVDRTQGLAVEPDHRPRFLRWLLPTSCSSGVPLDGMQQAELKLIAYH